MKWSKLEKILLNEPEYRKKQVLRFLFHNLVNDFTNTNISKDLKEKLKDFSLEIKAKELVSKDKQTIKALIELEDNSKVETVLMIHNDSRSTVCVSSQVGCGIGCLFCATGKMGFKRNLSYYEIVEQVLYFTRKHKVTNVVFMGMGEPFLNYENVIKAIKILNNSNYFNIGARKISVSTCGIIEGIDKIIKEDLQVNLSISLHAPNDKLRSKLMPINKKYPLDKLMKKVKEYIKKTSRKVMFEYVMIKGVNDSMENAEELYFLLKDIPLVMVNLIVYNPTGEFKPSDKKTVKVFKEYLEKKGIFTTQRYEFGREVKAACGQLGSKVIKSFL